MVLWPICKLIDGSGELCDYPQYFSGCNASRGQYQQAEAGARQNRLAFWSQPNPVAPWDFRSGRRRSDFLSMMPTTRK
ncbi:hypothetical protein [Argonema antarcticum]|uniref:hypothetical protein n=1 Tax=Argonema antarcticum TaxID=2942763 RepID=UPI0020130BD8|nr:hypothetical protein [Argonema antarcticum]MCL1475368.1 hypothetical protein [Argonema antarcticum A004/B2]